MMIMVDPIESFLGAMAKVNIKLEPLETEELQINCVFCKVPMTLLLNEGVNYRRCQHCKYINTIYSTGGAALVENPMFNQ